MSNKNILLGIIFISMLLFIFIARLRYYSEEKDLAQKYEIAIGKITYFGYSAGSATGSPEYTFNLNNHKIVESFKQNVFCRRLSNEDERIIKSIKFPVIYSPSNPDVSRILLKRSDFKKYEVPFPDSLKYVIEKYFDCD